MDLLTFSFDADSKMPIYHQLYRFIKNEIQTGKISYQSKLPSKRKLSAYLSISQNTIQAAYDQLIEEGYILPLERKGYYVNRIDHLQKLKVMTEKAEIKDVAPEETKVIYDFSYHGVDLSTFPFSVWRKLMKEVINEYDTELVKLGDSLGYVRLRTVIAEYLHQSRGVNCDMNQVIISSGTEILFQSLIQLFDQDYVYGIENPGYEKLNHLFTGNRAKFTTVPIDKSGMIPDEAQKSDANVLCITPAHQFPSGEIMPIARRMQLLNWADQDNNRYIIEDDYDSEFKYSGKPIPALQGLDKNEKVIYMGSLSKSLSPTIRVSYMVLPPRLMKQYIEKLSYQLCPVPIIDQKVLCLFFQEGYFERHLNKMRNIYRRKRETLIKSILELNCGIEIMGADAGLHLLIKVPNKMTEKELILSALQSGVRVYGIHKYYFDKSRIGKEPILVIGYASMTEEEIKMAVATLYQAWFCTE